MEIKVPVQFTVYRRELQLVDPFNKVKTLTTDIGDEGDMWGTIKQFFANIWDQIGTFGSYIRWFILIIIVTVALAICYPILAIVIRAVSSGTKKKNR